MGEGGQDAELVKMAREEQQELAKQVEDSSLCFTAVIDVLWSSDAAVKTGCNLKLLHRGGAPPALMAWCLHTVCLPQSAPALMLP